MGANINFIILSVHIKQDEKWADIGLENPKVSAT
jgi:hypothetical protein